MLFDAQNTQHELGEPMMKPRNSKRRIDSSPRRHARERAEFPKKPEHRLLRGNDDMRLSLPRPIKSHKAMLNPTPPVLHFAGMMMILDADPIHVSAGPQQTRPSHLPFAMKTTCRHPVWGQTMRAFETISNFCNASTMKPLAVSSTPADSSSSTAPRFPESAAQINLGFVFARSCVLDQQPCLLEIAKVRGVASLIRSCQVLHMQPRFMKI